MFFQKSFVLQKDAGAWGLSVVTVKYNAEKQSGLECWEWDNTVVKLLCYLFNESARVRWR